MLGILDAGNLSEAARRLKMTRANVSYHLNQLERAVGAQLVRRTTRRSEPTEIGLRLYQHGLSIQSELQAARDSVAALGKSPQGRVRLSVPSGYGQLVMSDWLIDFKRQYPGIVLDVLFENRIEDLLRDEVDIAVRVMAEPPQNLGNQYRKNGASAATGSHCRDQDARKAEGGRRATQGLPPHERSADDSDEQSI